MESSEKIQHSHLNLSIVKLFQPPFYIIKLLSLTVGSLENVNILGEILIVHWWGLAGFMVVEDGASVACQAPLLSYWNKVYTISYIHMCLKNLSQN